MFNNYYITEKTDGERVLILILYDKLHIIYSDKKIYKEYTIKYINMKIALDGEYYINNEKTSYTESELVSLNKI